MPAYLTSSDADAIAATLPAALLAAYLAADDAAKTAALVQASADVDAAGPYRGRRYDPPPAGAQTLEFPRVAYDTGVIATQFPVGAPFMRPDQQLIGDVIWDWDKDANGGQGAAVVPAD